MAAGGLPDLETRILRAVNDGETAEDGGTLGRDHHYVLEHPALEDENERAVMLALRRLCEAGYIKYVDSSDASRLALLPSDMTLTEPGLRAAGIWPRHGTLDALTATISELVDQTDDEEEKSRLRGLLSTVRTFSAETLTAIAKSWAMYYGGPGSPML